MKPIVFVDKKNPDHYIIALRFEDGYAYVVDMKDRSIGMLRIEDLNKAYKYDRIG